MAAELSTTRWVSPSDLYALIRPSRCELRVWLGSHGVEEAPPGAFGELLMQLGLELERFETAEAA